MSFWRQKLKNFRQTDTKLNPQWIILVNDFSEQFQWVILVGDFSEWFQSVIIYKNHSAISAIPIERNSHDYVIRGRRELR